MEDDKKTKIFNISSGPSKFDLMVALFARPDGEGNRSVVFGLDFSKESRQLRVEVCKVAVNKMSDGPDREHWIIDALAEDFEPPHKMQREFCECVIDFDTRTHTGHVTLPIEVYE